MSRNASGAHPLPRLFSLLALLALLLPTRSPAGPPTLAFAPPVDVPVAFPAGVNDPADLDGDGHLDLIGASGANVLILYGAGDGTFGPPVYIPTAPGPMGDIEAGDLDKDGLRDLVYSLPDANEVVVLRNQGGRNFAAPVVYAVTGSPLGMHLADVTKDGFLDLAVANDSGNKLTVLYNNGAGQFPSRSAFPGGTWPSRVTSGDWDHDGDVDLAMSNYGSADVGIYANNGDGSFTLTGSHTTGDYAAQVMAADFDRDGNLDLVTGNTFGGTISVLLGNGAGGFAVLSHYDGNRYPHILKVADLDGDLYPDIVSPNNGTNHFTVLRNLSGTDFEKLPTFTSTGDDLRTLGVGDLDEDGRPDVVTAHGSHAWVSVFLNRTPAAPPAAPVLLSATASAHNRVDLVWQDNSPTESEFRIERAPENGSFAEVGVAARNQTKFSDQTVAAGQVYRFRVVAVGEGGESPSNEKSVTTPGPPPAAPTNLQASEETPGVVRLTWTDPNPDEDGFLLSRELQGQGFPMTWVVEAGKTEYLDRNTAPNRLYTYKIQAYRGNELSAFSEPASILTLPAVPGALTATALSPSQIALVWSNPNGDGSFSHLERSADGGQSWTEIRVGGPAVTSHTDTGLETARSYRYRVRARNASGFSAFSPVVEESTFPEPPTAPSHLRVDALSAAALRLTWADTAVGETHFRIERKLGALFQEVGRVAAGETAFVHQPLPANTAQTYRVRAGNRGGDSPPTEEVAAFTLPRPPAGVSLQARAPRRLDLQWTDGNPAGAPAATEVHRSEDGGQSFQLRVTLPAGTSEYQDGSLEPDRQYTYQLRAVNPSGASDLTPPVNQKTWPVPPAAPTEFRVTGRTQTTLTFTWKDESPNEAGFRLERQQGSGWVTAAAVGVDATQVEVAGLEPDTPYTFRLIAHNLGGDSEPAGPLTTGTVPPPPGAPTGLTLTVDSDQQITLTWQDTVGETSYRLERRLAQESMFTVVATPGAGETSWTDSGLPDLTLCTYRLYAVNAGGEGGPAERAGTTLPRAPGSPGAGLRVREVELVWGDQSGREEGYRIERKTGSGAFQVVGTAPPNSTRYRDPGLTPGVTYTYQIRTFGAGIESVPVSAGPVLIPLNHPQAQVRLTPARVDFGKVKVQARRTRTLQIQNTGPVPVTVALSDPAAPFGLVTTPSVFTLGPRARRTVTLEVLSSTPGVKRAVVIVSTTATRLQQKTVPLKAQVK